MKSNSSIYIHIPFCKTICSYCDFCKLYYNQKWSYNYLKTLEQEINDRYHGQVLSTIYIGGGTPNSLSIDEFEYLLDILSKIAKSLEYEYTVECNIELLNEQQILLMKRYGVNRISLGVQTFNPKYLKMLNRHHTKEEVINKVKMLKEYGFLNINVDLMYAFPGETLNELQSDIDCILKLQVPHVSTYSLMIEPHTKLYCDNVLPIDDEIDEKMYNLICSNFSDYEHYEISNFARNGYESRHNLVYWNNEEYYGVGLGASGYVNGIRYTNTCNLSKYLCGNYSGEEHLLSKNEKMENEMILGLRKLKGVSLVNFYQKYGVNVEDVFKIEDLIDKKMLFIDQNYIKMNKDYIYISNDVLVHFIGSDSNE